MYRQAAKAEKAARAAKEEKLVELKTRRHHSQDHTRLVYR